MDSKRIPFILDFWFGPLPDDETFPIEKAEMWFKKGEDFDAEIRESFGPDLESAIRGERNEWAKDPQGRLALIILLDQFSRNIFRGTPQAFEQDTVALALAREGIEIGHDKVIKVVERVFFYMPYMHAENLEDQKKSVALYDALAQMAPPSLEFAIRNNLDYAKQHHEIVQRFGRFPHRNAILSRSSSAEEAAFLTTPGSSF